MDGCTCHRCGRRYQVDLLVDDAIWERIKPPAAAAGGGLLCPTCVVQRTEAALPGFGCWRLTVEGPVPPARVHDSASGWVDCGDCPNTSTGCRSGRCMRTRR